jgi:hypothetical protein
MIPRALGTIAAVTLLVSSVSSSAAQASPLSYCGSGCDWKNPATYLVQLPGGPTHYDYCASDAHPVKTLALSGYPKVQLRYSPACATAWARSDALGFTYAVQSLYSNGHVRATAYASGSSGVTWTAMFNDQGLLARACLVIPASGGALECTAAY